jgi:serine kinase of HPr protein (carbohydrate metabolism regulator)
MKLKDIVEELNLSVITGQETLDKDVTGGYASDLLSDVIANAKKGNIWVTLHVHQNIVAVATMKELTGIIIVNKRKPDDETLSKAKEENIPIMVSELPSFEIIGRLYKMGISGM